MFWAFISCQKLIYSAGQQETNGQDLFYLKNKKNEMV